MKRINFLSFGHAGYCHCLNQNLPVSGSLAIEKLLVHLQKNKNFTKEDFISKVNIIHGISNSFHWQTIYKKVLSQDTNWSVKLLLSRQQKNYGNKLLVLKFLWNEFSWLQTKTFFLTKTFKTRRLTCPPPNPNKIAMLQNISFLLFSSVLCEASWNDSHPKNALQIFIKK